MKASKGGPGPKTLGWDYFDSSGGLTINESQGEGGYKTNLVAKMWALISKS